MAAANNDTNGGTDNDRNARTFIFGGDDSDDTPRVVVLDVFQDRYGSTRVVLDTPAPWEIPDDMTSGNELIKTLEWDDHHYTFEETQGTPSTGRDVHENVWVIDESGLEPLQELVESEGYVWEDVRDDPSAGRPTIDPQLVEAAGFAQEGEWAVIRYGSKQSGNVKSKEGSITVSQAGGQPGLSTGLVIRRDDSGINKVRPDDNGDAAVFSLSQYPFMGNAISVEILPGEGLTEDEWWEEKSS